jgi:hypothetical protein
MSPDVLHALEIWLALAVLASGCLARAASRLRESARPEELRCALRAQAGASGPAGVHLTRLSADGTRRPGRPPFPPERADRRGLVTVVQRSQEDRPPGRRGSVARLRR